MHMRTMLAASVAAALGLYGSHAQAQLTPGEYVLPVASTPTIPGSNFLKNGGFSSLIYLGNNDFWTITDRGPNTAPPAGSSGNLQFLVPGFTPTMFRLRLDPTTMTFSIVDSIRLARPNGTPTTGLPEPAPWANGDVAVDTLGNLLGTDDYGFDTEGIARASDGTFWICEEYAPGIAQVNDATGRIIRRARPGTNPGDLPDILKKRTPNRGFEGIAVTPNGKIYAIVQSGMTNPDATAANNTEMLRLVEYDPSTGNSRMFVYLIDSYPVTGSDIRRRDIKIGDMAALNNNEFLLIEHAQRGTQNVKLVYRINIAGATPITTETFNVGGTKTLEQLTTAQLSSVAGLTPVTKTLLIDLLNPGPGNPVWPAALDKAEGLAMINATTLVVGNDNDFGVGDGTTSAYSLTGKPSEMLVYRIAAQDFRLPVELAGFDLTSSNGNAYLSWRTASEVSNAGFEVYRAADSSSDYRLIASWLSDPDLTGLGTSSSGRSYNYVDAGLTPGATYSYRLVDVTVDGTRNEHPPMSIRIESDESPVGLYATRLDPVMPNPTQGNINCTFSLPGPMAVTLDVFNEKGSLVTTLLAAGSYDAGSHTLAIPTNGLPSGAYLLRLTAGREVRTQRFVVAR